LIKKIKKENETNYFPILDEKLFAKSQKIAQQLRRKGENVEISLEVQKLGKALELANKKGFKNVG
jgi:histidyl-tRNA synthetase